MTATPLPTKKRDWQRLIDDLGLRPSKGRGQNFLHDPAVIHRIVKEAEIAPDDHVLEIGPGLGILTQELLNRTFAGKAIELDPTLAEPHTSLAFTTWLLDWDKSAAEKEFLRSIELNPNYPTAHHWYSRFLRGVGRYDEAWQEINRAKELEPLSIIFLNNIAEMQTDRGELEAAAATAEQIMELDPNFWASHQSMGVIRVKQRRFPDALAEAEKSTELSGRANPSLAFLAHVNGLLGKRDVAERMIKELEQRYADKMADGRDVAIAYVGLGEHDRAFEWLEKAYKDKSVFMGFLNLEPLLEPLHHDPRWADLKRRVGIPN